MGDDDGDLAASGARAAVAVVALRVALTGMALVAGVSGIVGRESLGGWTFGVVVVAGAVVLALWGLGPAGSARGAVVATALAVAGAAMAATGLDRTERHLAARVLGRDLPPRAVYAATLVFVLVAIAAAVLAVAGRAVSTRGRSVRAGVGIGVVAAVVLSSATVSGAALARSLDDHRLESRALTHTVTRPAERLRAGPGPARPARAVWTVDVPEAPARGVAAAAVPGWDVVLLHKDDFQGEAATSRLIALSATDGSELWRYERHGEFSSVTADPESGRVLLVNRYAAIVLSLEDGDELATVQLRDQLACWKPVSDRFADGTQADLGIAIGSTAVMICADDWNRPAGDQPQIVAMLDVATGRVTATGDSPGDHGDCAYAAATPGATSSPVLVRWGIDNGNDDGCGPPMLLAPDAAGEIRPVMEVRPPAEATGEGCRRPVYACEWSRLVATDDTIVLALDWPGGPSADSDDELAPVLDLVALSPEGEMLWRRTGEDGGASAVTATDRGVIVRDGTEWRLLSLEDGRQLARSPDRGGDAVLDTAAAPPVSDGEHVYAFSYDVGLVVRSADDASPTATAADVRSSIYEPAVTAGRLVVLQRYADDRYALVAYADR